MFGTPVFSVLFAFASAVATAAACGPSAAWAAHTCDPVSDPGWTVVAAEETLSQVDGARWLSLEGKSSVNTETDAVRDAELRYAQRYRTPRVNPKRVVIEVRVERVLGSSDLLVRAED